MTVCGIVSASGRGWACPCPIKNEDCFVPRNDDVLNYQLLPSRKLRSRRRVAQAFSDFYGIFVAKKLQK
jgi:hypothetical protein